MGQAVKIPSGSAARTLGDEVRAVTACCPDPEDRAPALAAYVHEVVATVAGDRGHRAHPGGGA
ncbi:hypothetical protein [Streptomyces sp. NPDC005799]|uniref:hypothetical protein n=1 Tax=Streptomyces sp. NPDC005799 TaxID=3154678 RepID=UPI0033E78701